MSLIIQFEEHISFWFNLMVAFPHISQKNPVNASLLRSLLNCAIGCKQQHAMTLVRLAGQLVEILMLLGMPIGLSREQLLLGRCP